jgi:hypothetical protein
MADHCKIYFISPDGHVIIKEEAKKSGVSDVLDQSTKITAVLFEKCKKFSQIFFTEFPQVLHFLLLHFVALWDYSRCSTQDKK